MAPRRSREARRAEKQHAQRVDQQLIATDYPHHDYIPDFEAAGAFPGALARRAQASSRGLEVVLFVLDVRHVRWAHNLLLNLAEHGLAGRALGIGQSAESCASLFSRLPPAAVSCGHSNFLRRADGNTTITAALDRWKIAPWHVYHLWWQRWRYLSWAATLGYNALSLDSDISLRANPYDLFHGALAHRQLIVGLDSEASGESRPGLFPMINVGIVYCRTRARSSLD